MATSSPTARSLVERPRRPSAEGARLLLGGGHQHVEVAGAHRDPVEGGQPIVRDRIEHVERGEEPAGDLLGLAGLGRHHVVLEDVGEAVAGRGDVATSADRRDHAGAVRRHRADEHGGADLDAPVLRREATPLGVLGQRRCGDRRRVGGGGRGADRGTRAPVVEPPAGHEHEQRDQSDEQGRADDPQPRAPRTRDGLVVEERREDVVVRVVHREG